jgi:ATP-dependent RNA helicase RhlE
MQFDQSGLSAPLLDAITTAGYHTPTPIQAQAIPPILSGKDLMAIAQTGTGKTAAFALPLLERLTKGPTVQPNQARALILVPTRELAVQVEASIRQYGANLPLRTAAVFGGVKINPQMMRLRRGVDILVATPGRLLDLFRVNAVRFKFLETLVLDEADRMLDLGFITDIRKIMGLIPKNRQTLLFSATLSDDIRKLARRLLDHPVELTIGARNTPVKKVEQWICPVDKKKKALVLDVLIHTHHWTQVLVFTKTKLGADKLVRFLQTKGVNATAIHGDKSQGARTQALTDFKQGVCQVLVATDIAARGLDIDQLPHVINFDLPIIPEEYVHRIGRTARAGASGMAISLVSADEFPQLSAIEACIRQVLPRRYVDGYEPKHDVPASRLPSQATPPRKPKKPKKPKTAQTPTRGNENSPSHTKTKGRHSGHSAVTKSKDTAQHASTQTGRSRHSADAHSHDTAPHAGTRKGQPRHQRGTQSKDTAAHRNQKRPVTSSTRRAKPR